jgi:hypothetical protein
MRGFNIIRQSQRPKTARQEDQCLILVRGF